MSIPIHSLALYLVLFFSLFEKSAYAAPDRALSKNCQVRWGLIPEFSKVKGIVIAPEGESMSATIDILRSLPRDTEVYFFETPNSWFEAAEFRQYHPKIVPFESPVPGPWTRDFMPRIVKRRDGTTELVQFSYTYNQPGMMEGAQSRNMANRAGEELARWLGVNHRKVDLEIQGGAFYVDGKNRLYITNSQHTQYNAKISKAQMTKTLKEALDVDQVVWLDAMPGEATGHVDMFFKPIDESTAIVSRSKDPARAAHGDRIAKLVAEKFGFRVIRVDNAKDTEQTAHGYANALVVGDKVFVPQYSKSEFFQKQYPAAEQTQIVAADKAALDAYVEAGFERGNVIGVDASVVIQKNGAIHCITCQVNWEN